jgi:hypothetical protein
VTKICFQVRLTHALGRSIFTVTIYYTGVEAARGDTHGSRIVTSAHIPALDNSLLDTSGRTYPPWNTVNRVCKALSSFYSANSSIFAVASFPRLQTYLDTLLHTSTWTIGGWTVATRAEAMHIRGPFLDCPEFTSEPAISESKGLNTRFSSQAEIPSSTPIVVNGTCFGPCFHLNSMRLRMPGLAKKTRTSVGGHVSDLSCNRFERPAMTGIGTRIPKMGEGG